MRVTNRKAPHSFDDEGNIAQPKQANVISGSPGPEFHAEPRCRAYSSCI
uniref:Uncharacterized protein n=1 Tax=Tetraselmis sp. GSL018 TaxID=582737 RepID=A0A061R6C0_9CHLO